MSDFWDDMGKLYDPCGLTDYDGDGRHSAFETLEAIDISDTVDRELNGGSGYDDSDDDYDDLDGEDSDLDDDYDDLDDSY